MPADQILSLAQLCVRTGRFAKGDALIPSIQKEQAKVVLLSDGCGANRAKKIQDKCAYYQIPLIVLPSAKFESISSKINGAFAILDPGFAKGIIQAAEHREDVQAFNLTKTSKPETSQ